MGVDGSVTEPVPDAAHTRRLTLGEWAVLGLLASESMHAFALVKATAPEGPVGRVWSVPTPVVYRAVNRLRDLALIEPLGEERSESGPPRTVLGITPTGRAVLQAWLTTPVEHLRDVRSAPAAQARPACSLDQGPGPLVEAQLRAFAPVLDALERRAAAPGRGFDRTLAQWRFESARSVTRFLQSIDDDDD